MSLTSSSCVSVGGRASVSDCSFDEEDSWIEEDCLDDDGATGAAGMVIGATSLLLFCFVCSLELPSFIVL